MKSGCVLFMMWLKTFPTRPTSKFLFCHRVFLFIFIPTAHTVCVFYAVLVDFPLFFPFLFCHWVVNVHIGDTGCPSHVSWISNLADLFLPYRCLFLPMHRFWHRRHLFFRGIFLFMFFYLGSMNGWEYAHRGQESTTPVVHAETVTLQRLFVPVHSRWRYVQNYSFRL